MKLTEEELDELRLDAALHVLPGVASTFGRDIEERREVIAHKSMVIADEFVRKWQKRQEEKEAWRATCRGNER